MRDNIQRIQIISLLLLINSILLSQNEWIQVESPTTKKIWRIVCLDSLNCWAAGDSGLILHSSNGGSNWEIQEAEIFNNILDIFFLNNNLGWAVAIKFDEPSGSYLLKTTNGGENWNSQLFDSNNVYFFTVNFLDSLNGFLAGAPSYVFYRTSDGGLTWNTVQFDSSIFSGLPIIDLEFYSKQYGFACGGQRDVVGVIWKTTDFGFSWSSYDLGPEPLTELFILDSLNIFGVGGDYEYGAGLARTSNAGVNWLYFEPGIFGVATGLSFRTRNEGWACITGEGKFLVTTNSGVTWEIRLAPGLVGINDITFTDSLHGFAVGDGGVILKYKPKPASAGEEEINMPTTHFLFQNYPNPFNPITKISWQSSAGSLQTLKIYDILGNEIVTLANEYKPAGNHKVEFNAGERLPSGVYFYQLQIGEHILTKKLLLLR